MSENRPSSGVLIAEAAMYAVPTQAKRSNALNSPAIVGSAVETIEISIEASNTDSISDPSTTHSRAFVIPGTVELVAILCHRRSERWWRDGSEVRRSERADHP